jgi:hypothetical protein
VEQSLVNNQLMLDPVPHERAQEQGSLLVAYSSAANQVSRMLNGQQAVWVQNYEVDRSVGLEQCPS